MIQTQLKLRLTKKQEITLNEWLLSLTRVWNWAIRKIELDGQDKVYYSKNDFQNLLSNHGQKIGIASHTVQGMLRLAWESWGRCYKKIAKKPNLKGLRNKLNSIPFPDKIRRPQENKIRVPKIGKIRYHRQDIPDGIIKCGRLIKRASGWYICLFIDVDPEAIVHKGDSVLGIDPGFKTCLTTSKGEKIEKPKRLKELAKRLAQAQRGKNRKLVAIIQERLRNRRKDDNHKLSKKLVEENKEIYFSKDNIKKIAKKFGRSVAEACHYQLRRMLEYKSIASGRLYVEVDSKFSTMTCSDCFSRTGPTGKAGLSVRNWECKECGFHHDRDVNAATNTLLSGLGLSLECAIF